jgi:hypothetical protein
VTVNVTGTLNVPPGFPHVPVVQVNTTLPLYVPVAKPLTETDTVSVPCVEPLVGNADSQLPPEVVLVVTVYEIGVAGVELVMVSVWPPGVEPALELKLKEVGLDCIEGSDERFSVTPT